MPGHKHTPKSELDEYSCLHKLCFTSANSRQTFSQNAHEADQQPLPPSLQPPLCSTWQCIISSPHSHHQPCSLNITICLIVPSNFPSPHPLPLSLHYFCSTTPLSPPSPLSWGYWPTWQALMISPVYVAPPPPVPGWPPCLLIILSSAQPEALSTMNLLPFYQTNPPHMLLPASFRDHYHLRSQHWTHFHFSCLPLLLSNTTFHISSSPSPATAQPGALHICQYFPSLPSYPRRRCWIPAEIWRSQKWSGAGPWSFHTGRRLRGQACLSRWVEPEAGQSFHFLLSEGSHGDPPGGRNGRWTGHLRSGSRYDHSDTKYIKMLQNVV